MGLLDNFERGVSRVVNGAFARTFRSGVQPVDIASALKSELDGKAAIVSRERILVPNEFVVSLSTEDHAQMSALGAPLTRELQGIVTTHVRSQGYTLPGRLSITLTADPKQSVGTVRVHSSRTEGNLAWQAVIDVAGRRYPLAQARTVIGRGSDADITISDAGASRRHAEVLWDGERAMVRDLGSTNGTKLGGRRITEAALPPDATISIGNTSLIFRIVAETQRTASPAGQFDDATRAFPTSGSD